MLLNSCRRESVGRAVGRTVVTVSSANLENLLSQMEVSLPPPQAAAAAITDSKEKDSASTWHRGTVSRADNPTA